MGIETLMRRVTGIDASIYSLPIDLEEGTIMEVLKELEYVDLHVFDDSTSSAQRIRANIRYLAAIWPEASITELGQRIHQLMNNRNVSFSDVMTVLRGERLSERAQLDDLRIVLRGGQIGNPQRTTREVPVPVIQGVGRCLRTGVTLAETARLMHVSRDTVRAIEGMLGLRSAYKQKLLAVAVDAARDGISIREFARAHGLTKTTAATLLTEGRSVLVEIGEA